MGEQRGGGEAAPRSESAAPPPGDESAPRSDAATPRPGDDLLGDTGSFRYRGPAYRATAGPRVVPPHPSRVDLHAHSRRSDGVLEPLDLVAAAGEAGVKLLALADHDTLAGVRELAVASRKGPGLPLEVLPSVEINSVARGIERLWEGELHILGLGVDPGSGEFEATLERQRGFRVTRFWQIVERLRELGLGVDEQIARLEPQPGASLGRPQIARCLVAAGHAASVDDAMQRLLARGRPAYVPRNGLGPIEAIRAIRDAGGMASLAHFADAPERADLVRELRDAGLAGLEVHYRHFDALTVEALERVARELRLVATGGSDYHGDGESYAEAHAQLFVPDRDAAAVLTVLDRSHPDFPASSVLIP